MFLTAEAGSTDAHSESQRQAENGLGLLLFNVSEWLLRWVRFSKGKVAGQVVTAL